METPVSLTHMVSVDAAALPGWPLPLPGGDADKEARGHVPILGGSREMPGALILAATAALRAGAGKPAGAWQCMRWRAAGWPRAWARWATWRANCPTKSPPSWPSPKPPEFDIDQIARAWWGIYLRFAKTDEPRGKMKV